MKRSYKYRAYPCNTIQVIDKLMLQDHRRSRMCCIGLSVDSTHQHAEYIGQVSNSSRCLSLHWDYNYLTLYYDILSKLLTK